MGVDVVDDVRLDAGRLEGRAHHAIGAVAVLGLAGHVEGVAGHAVADHLGVDRRAAAPRELQLLEDEDAGALAEHEAVAILVERPAGALRVVVARATARAWPRSRPRPSAHTAASEPPAIIASAAPRLMISKASPRACADAVHAVHVAEFGPLAPKRMETCPEARLMMAAGMKNGEIRRGPPSRKARCSRSMVVNPPIPEAMNTPTRGAIVRRDRQPRIVHRRTATRRWRTG